MGYDMTMTKVKKSDLDTLKKQHPKASLSDLWDMLITYYTEKEFEDEYGKENYEIFKKNNMIFCTELVYSNKRIFEECSMIPNDENDFTMELSLEETKKLFSWLDSFLRNDFLDNIEKYYGKAYDTTYFEMYEMLRDMQEDEVVLFHQDW